ncbi:microtubule-associated protein 9 isoform X4 [Pimephales promelas]|uniref:microtubule-associated protein 9 isoform X4 n=1 Tax=Pimephales promelas TaxID=90988 RepID=UPI0019558D64|nr:microtubule-associated protein 9 isoform X4 [Pimephales promelas]KAG1956846.1 microtubule-associated protein [Pimephales promelas]
MNDEPFSTTLAYTKSPKTSRRTTFQDELKKAVSARANKHSYSDDFEDDDDDEEDGKNDDDDDDDTLNKLLKRQKQKKERFKAGRTKGKINYFKLSDDEEENVKPKKVSFMKTKRTSSPVHFEQLNSMGSADGPVSSFHSTQSRNTSHSPSDSYTPEKNQQSDSLFSPLSDKFQPEFTLLQKDEQSKSVMRLRNQTESVVRKSLSESPLPLNSENSLWESSIPITSEGSQWDSPVPLPSDKDEANQRIGEDGDLPIPQPRERTVKPKLSTGYVAQDMSPRPKPRQRTANMCDPGQLEEETQAETPGFSRTATSSMSIPFSTRSSSEKSQTSTTESVQGADEHQAMSENSITQSFSNAEQVIEAPATADSVASEECKERNHSTSFEEKHGSSQDDLDYTSTTESHMSRKSKDRTSSSQSSSSKSKSSYIVESKYLGTLKILDQVTQEIQQVPEAADSLRAAVYQEWLKKKEETLKKTSRAKKQEEKLKEEKMQEEKLAKIADGKASYDAWKEKKSAVIRKINQEKQKSIHQQQMEMDKIQEKKVTAKQVFEKWKEEHDSILKDRIKEKKQTEIKEKLQQVREKEERKKDCTSAFTEWSDRKRDVIKKKVRAEHRKEKVKEVEEKYEKEENEKMALEMYDKWLRRKELQQKREKNEKRIQTILQDEPTPPWSPPNKTIPFGK